ncbi:epidermal growth factor receptor kinase substrate 8-like protein 3 isoform X1 [Pleurodeles waltl]|uniref:epidermal growth factor receptor kinase substrate 8-like protein 3 isoform X1 n=2 Tax=Pleurodeles waltl TaxID=8319 RepID=UPI0037093DCF
MNQYGRYRDSGMYDSGLSSGEADLKTSPSMSRPSGKSIYQQRKQYSQAVVSLHDKIQQRVEHLLTCEVDSEKMRTVEDAIARLKLLDSQGRVWGQDLILQVKDEELSLTDIETREELDCFSLDSVLSCNSILNSGTYNSVLALTIRELQARRTSIFLFQCEELGAELLQVNIEKSMGTGRRREEEPNQMTLRNNLENMLSQQVLAPLRGRSTTSQRNTWRQPEEPQMKPRPPAQGPREEYPQNLAAYELIPSPRTSWEEPGPMNSRNGMQPQEMDLERDTEILNHVLGDIELFLTNLKQVTGSNSTNGTKKTKKKKKNAPLPPDYEYTDTLQKIKYAFNLLGKIDTGIQQPSAPDLVHIIFQTLTSILSHCPRKDMAPSVISPLLTQKAINLLNSCITEQERNMWKSLGDAWMVTRADWPNGKNIQPYIPTFSDGWMPRMPLNSESKQPMSNTQVVGRSPQSTPRESTQEQLRPLLMRAMYDFIGRNNRELTIMKGDVVEVLDQSKQWWMVKTSSNERGYIPNNVLEPLENTSNNNSKEGPDVQGPVVLSPTSSTKEVATWLRTHGFSKLTETCLGVLTGQQLLDLSRDELKTVCPEEGGRVFHLMNSGKLTQRPGR